MSTAERLAIARPQGRVHADEWAARRQLAASGQSGRLHGARRHPRRPAWRPLRHAHARHGLLAWGQTLPQTFAILWTLQRACEIQLATFSMGGAQAAIPVSEAVAAKCTRDALQFNPNHGARRDVFDALVRLSQREPTR